MKITLCRESNGWLAAPELHHFSLNPNHLLDPVMCTGFSLTGIQVKKKRRERSRGLSGNLECRWALPSANIFRVALNLDVLDFPVHSDNLCHVTPSLIEEYCTHLWHEKPHGYVITQPFRQVTSLHRRVCQKVVPGWWDHLCQRCSSV